MRQTIEHYPKLAHELARLGVDELSFNALGGRDRPEFYPEARIAPAQWQQFTARLPELRAQLRCYGAQLLGQFSYLQRIAASTQELPVSVSSCTAAEQFLFIDASGRIAPCSQSIDEYGIDLDLVRDAHTLNVLPDQFRQAQLQRRASSCADCPSTQLWGKFAKLAPTHPPAS
jgi:radical SAM protein with 4Fe4S-binding SPASM domain